MSRYHSLVTLKERAVAQGEMDIAEAIQRLLDAYYNRVEPHKQEVQPKKWYSRLFLWLKEA